MQQPVFVSNSFSDLGEGLALGADGTVAWLDIHGSKILILRDDIEQCFTLKSQATVIFRVSDHSLEFGSEAGIITLDFNTGVERRLISPPPQKRQCLRSNDGCYVGDGRYLMGFMHPSEPSINPGQIFYYCGDAWHLIDGDIAIPNTFLQISEGEFLISDSLLGVIWKYTVRLDGQLAGREVWLEFEHGAPDGGCIYKDYALIAVWDAGCVALINLVNKKRVDFSVPMLRPTNCAVNSDGSRLWITSAREGLLPNQLNAYPLSGATVALEVAF